MAILALVFFLERTAFVDLSFHLFEIFRTGEPAIQNYRFVSILTQVFPWLGSKLGMDLGTILKLYSLSFVLLYYSVFAFCVLVLKRWRFGLLMLLMSTLMVTDTFYWVQSEFPQGLAVMVAYFALLCHSFGKKSSTLFMLVPALGIMIATVAFAHPLIVFPFTFCSAFLFLHDKKWRVGTFLSWLCFLGVFAIKAVYFKTSHDSSGISAVNNFKTLFPDYFSLLSHSKFWRHLWQDYYLLAISFLGSLVFYFSHKMYLKGLLVLTFSLGYLLLVNVSYPSGAIQFYAENLYLPLSVFVIVPLVFDLSDLLKIRLFTSLLSAVLLIRLIHIGVSSKPYAERVDYLRTVIRETEPLEHNKVIASERIFSLDTLLMTWATPYESWLISTVEGGETRSVLITDNIEGQNWTGPGYETKFITIWGAFDYSDLPDEYFVLPDTSMYKLLEQWPIVE
ncbi:MAG: hypothetical protein AAF741_09855 [Bacteroidota bacterium]